jgi:hypothetical protein
MTAANPPHMGGFINSMTLPDTFLRPFFKPRLAETALCFVLASNGCDSFASPSWPYGETFGYCPCSPFPLMDMVGNETTCLTFSRTREENGDSKWEKM